MGSMSTFCPLEGGIFLVVLPCGCRDRSLIWPGGGTVLGGLNDDAASRSRSKASSLRYQSPYTAEDERNIQRDVWGQRTTSIWLRLPYCCTKRLSLDGDIPSKQVRSNS